MRPRERQLWEVIDALRDVLSRVPGARLLRRVPDGLRAAASVMVDDSTYDVELDLTALEDDLGPVRPLSVFEIRSKED